MMNKQQIAQSAEKYADENFVDRIVKDEPWPTTKAAFTKTFIDGADFALSRQWVSVDDALPDDDRLVLAHFADVEKPLEYATAYYRNGIWNVPDDFYYDCEIDFWLPIPEMNPEKEER